VRRRIRTSFALRLLAAGVGLSLVLITGISAFLLISRQQQTRAAALSNADNRAKVIGQLFEQITRPTLQLEARTAASAFTGFAQAHSPADFQREVAAFEQGVGQGAFGEYPTFVDADGVADGPPGEPLPDAASLAVRAALAGTRQPYGLEVIQGRAVSDAAEPVADRTGTPVGAVVEVLPLLDQLSHFQGVIGYPTAFIPAQETGTVARLSRTASNSARGTTPPAIVMGIAAGAQAKHPPATYDATYDVPGTGAVAGSFLPMRGPDGRTAGYVGVEVPLSAFVGDLRGDAITLALISVFAVLGTALLVFLFVERFVRRPVNRLERGVARIAGGDYSMDIPVTSSDELGRLAGNVNRMRAEIARYVTDIEQARARLDAAVDQLGGVSRALTTTTHGLPGLQEAVVEAAAAIVAQGSAALLLLREGDGLRLRASHGIEDPAPDIAGWQVGPELLAGRAVHVAEPPHGWQAGEMLAVPMFYQDTVVGALAVITPAGAPPADGQEQSLTVLANNAAIALENTRLFERERETVRRLRELDAMKSDFLGTVQHELRTPLTAIMGMGDLLEMCWDTWDDAHKTEALHDIQVAAKRLYDIVETILDFSLLESDTLSLRPLPTRVRGAVEEALSAVQGRLKDGLQVSVRVDVDPDIEVHADPNRFGQALRALLDNAVKFTPEGGRIWVRGHRNGGGMVRIEVGDTGIGIPDEALTRVFERFYQVDNSATRTYGGTGMGLALVQRLAEAHGGTVEVESRVGEGTCFSLVWPIAPIVM
jgi:signal transduction histidine kinase/HAMP domain-containing protein